MSNVEVESEDIIRVVLQFLKENKLEQSFRVLQNETKVSLNTFSNPSSLVGLIRKGKWDEVLVSIQELRLPYSKLANLYEQIILELLEQQQLQAVAAILREGKQDISLDDNDQGFSSIFIKMRIEEPNRFIRLEKLANFPTFVHDQAYPDGSTKEKRRVQIAQEIVDEMQNAPPNRLLSLITEALRFQQLQGMLPEGQKYDLFREEAPENLLPELYPSRMHGQIKFSKNSFPCCAAFSPDGQSLLTGSVDGMIEVWNFATCKIRKDLAYQESENFMFHRSAVLCLAFSRNSSLIAAGDKNGSIKVWEIESGKCRQTFNKSHEKSVSALCFSKKGNKILSCSQDETVRIHGRQSGTTLTTLRGHTSFVNDCCWSSDEVNVISASSDGTVKIWNASQGVCVFTFQPGNGALHAATVNNIQIHPITHELIVCNRSQDIVFFTLNGMKVTKTLTNSRKDDDFVRCTTSYPDGLWLYAITVSGVICCFNTSTGKLTSTVSAHDRETVGLVCHPHRNFVASFTEGRLLKLWKPSNSQTRMALVNQQEQSDTVIEEKPKKTTTGGTTNPKIQFAIKKQT